MTIWEILGTEPTKDLHMIKNAYRSRLVHVNPEDDEEGFKKLRSAYEEACALAQKSDESAKVPETPLDHWIEKAAAIYERFYDRIDIRSWEPLFDDELCVRLDLYEETRIRFLNFCMSHSKYPNTVWKLFNKVFLIEEDKDTLTEYFPENFIEYALNSIKYDSFLDYTLFDGEDDADYDSYIDSYFELKNAVDTMQTEKVPALFKTMEAMDIYHPYYDAEKAKYAIFAENRTEYGSSLMEELVSQWTDSAYLWYCCGRARMMNGKADEAEEAFSQALELMPEYYSAKFEMANVKQKKAEAEQNPEGYIQVKELYLDLLDINSEDMSAMEKMRECNEVLIRYYEECYEKTKDVSKALDLGWCLCQNEQYEKCRELLKTLEVDEANQYDYINLSGRIYLCLGDYDSALPYLHRWLEEIGKTEDNGSEENRRRIKRNGYANYALAVSYANKQTPDLKKALYYIKKALASEENEEQLRHCAYAEADIYFRLGENERCVDLCSRLLKDDEYFYPAVVLRQEAYLKLKYYQNVIDDYDRAVRIYPYESIPYELAAQVFYDFGQDNDVFEVVKKAEEFNAVSCKLKKLYVRAKLHAADTKDAYTAILAEIGKLYDSEFFKPSEEKAFLHAMEALAYGSMISYGKDADGFKKALESVQEALKLEGGNEEYESIRAWIYFKYGDYENAEKSYEALSLKYPDNLFYQMRLGAVCGELRELKKAREVYERIAESDSSYPEIHRELGIIYRELAEEEEDRQYYEKGICQFTLQLEIKQTEYDLIERGRMLMECARYNEARADFEEALSMNRNNIYAMNGLGDIFRYQRRYEAAAEWYEKAAMTAGEEDTPIIYENMAQCMECLEKYSEAEQWFERLLKKYPKRGYALDKYGNFLMRMQRYKEAAAVFAQGRLLSENYRRYFGFLEAKAMENYDIGAAKKFYKAYLKSDKNDLRANMAMGKLYFGREGKYKKALMFFERVLETAGENIESEIYQDCCFYMGAIYMVMNKREKASLLFQKALEVYIRKYPMLLKDGQCAGFNLEEKYRIGRLLAVLGMQQKAALYFKTLEESDIFSDHEHYDVKAKSAMGQGLLLAEEGKTAQALKCCQKALTYMPYEAGCRAAVAILLKKIKGKEYQ